MKINYQKEICGVQKDFNLQILKNNNFYEINCMSQNDENMGFITFKIYNSILWIYKIETNKNFYRQGVASAILDITEYIAITHNANRIEGKFMPNNQYARPFYEKNGFEVPNKVKSWDTYDPYWIMYKCLDAKAIKNKVANNITICKDDSVTLK